MHKFISAITLATLMVSSPWALANQDPAISIELNKIEQADANCRLLFLARNGLNQSIGNLAFETVLLDQQGSISRLTVLDFMDLPANKLRMRQFEFPNLQCNDVKQVLFNNVMNCANQASEQINQCSNQLQLTSSTNIEVLD